MPRPDTFPLVHPTRGRVTVSRQQFEDKGNTSGWNEADSRKAGYVPEHEPKGKKIGDELDAKAAKPAAPVEPPKDPQDPPKDPQD